MTQNPTKDPRSAANLRIKFRSDNLPQFIERYAMDVSRGGIFIRTREPLAVGTSLKLDFQFQNGGALLAGEGTVVWVREVDPKRTNVPPGMGVRFDKLSAESQAALEQILIEKAKREGNVVPGAARVPRTATPPGLSSAPAAAATEDRARAAGTPVAHGSAESSTNGSTDSSATVPASGSRPSEVSKLQAEPASNDRASSADPDEMDEEPTQIASGLPSFLAQGNSARPEGEVAQRLPGMSAPTSAASDGAVGASAPASANGSGKTHPGVAPTAIGAGAEVKGHADPAAPKESRHTPSSGVPAMRAAGELEPGLAAVFAPRPKTADGEPEHAALASAAPGGDANPPGASSSQSPPSPPNPSSSAANRTGEQRGAIPEPPSGAHARGVRVPGPVILVSVLALATAGFFLVRFFRSEATETIPAVQPAGASPAVIGPEPTGAAVLAGPAGVAAGAAVPLSAATSPVTAPADSVAAEKPVAPSDAAATSTGANTAPAAGNAPAAADSPPAEPPTPNPAAPVPAAPTAAPHTVRDPGNGKLPANTSPKRRPLRLASAPSAASSALAEAHPSGKAEPTPPGTAVPSIYQLKITSRPLGAEVSIDGALVGKTPFAGTLPDLAESRVVALKKAGFEPFEQMVSSTSAWTKTRGPRGVPTLQQLKISPKLRALTTAGDGRSAGLSTGGDPANAASATKTAKTDAPDDSSPPPPEPPVPADGTQ